MYKTILMHCNDQRRIRNLLLPAVDLAEKHQAHLTALSVVPPIAIFTSVDGSVLTVDAHCRLYREENPGMRQAFEESVRGRGFTAEWRDDDARALPVIECVLPYARAADLIVCQPGRLSVARVRPARYRRSVGAGERAAGFDHPQYRGSRLGGRKGACGVERPSRGRARCLRCTTHTQGSERGKDGLGESAVGRRSTRRYSDC